MKKRKFRRKVIIVVTALVLGISIFISSRERNFLWIEKPIKEVVNGIQKGFQIPFLKMSDKTNLLDLSLSKEKDIELNQLKELLKLNRLLSDFQVVYATTINRNVSLFQELLTIDKGEKEGIQKDMAVVTSSGLIGKVEKTTAHFSEVRLLTASSENYQISVKVNSNENSYFGVLNQYDLKKNVFYITGIPSSASVEVGDTVTTSGIGGIFPSGIYIGKITYCTNDSYGITKILEIEASQDFNDLKYVGVLTTGDNTL